MSAATATEPATDAPLVGTELRVEITRGDAIRDEKERPQVLRIEYMVCEGEYCGGVLYGIWSLKAWGGKPATTRLLLGRQMYEWGFRANEHEHGFWLQRAAAEDLAAALIGRIALVRIGAPVAYADGVARYTVEPTVLRLYDAPQLPAYQPRQPRRLPEYATRKEQATQEIVREYYDEEGQLQEAGEPEHRPTQRGNVYETLVEYARDRAEAERRLTAIYVERGLRNADDPPLRRPDGLNHDDIHLLSGERLNSIRPRLDELQRQGFIRETQKVSETSAGSSAMNYIADESTVKGYDVDGLATALRAYEAWRRRQQLEHDALLKQEAALRDEHARYLYATPSKEIS